MAISPTLIGERLIAEGQKTKEFFQGLSEPDWDRRVYTEGASWTVRQVLCHFVNSELGFTRLLEQILAGGPGSPPDFDLDRYNERKVAQLESTPPAELIERYSDARQLFAGLVSRMAPEDLRRTGRHPFLGTATLEEMTKMAYLHNQIHLREIRRVVRHAE